MKSRGVKIVCKANGARRRNDVDVFDLETGEKLTDIYEIDLGVTREAQTIRVTSGAPWVYEGQAEFETPQEILLRRIVELEKECTDLRAGFDVLTDPDELRAARIKGNQ